MIPDPANYVLDLHRHRLRDAHRHVEHRYDELATRDRFSIRRRFLGTPRTRLDTKSSRRPTPPASTGAQRPWATTSDRA